MPSLVSKILLTLIPIIVFGVTLNKPYLGFAAPTASITISFIDVGQGDSILVRDSTGYDILIDGGKPAAGPVVLAFLRDLGVDDIDVMLATHADSDHIGGLIEILNALDLPVEAVFYNGYPGSTVTWNSFVTAVAEEGIPLSPAQFPDSFTWGQMVFTIYNPVAGLSDPEQNDISVVAMMAFGQNQILFTGDISSVIETELLNRGVSLTAQILKVAHHGSSGSSSGSFLAQVTPIYSVISVGENPYGHPAPATLARLQAIGAAIWRTDFNGTITITCDESACSFPFQARVHVPSVMQVAIPGIPVQTQKISITNIYYDGIGSTEPDEYVEIQNTDTVAIQLQNWTLHDNADHLFTFPAFTIQPDQICRVYTNEVHPEWCSFNYSQGTSIWNNSGDCAYLLNTQGKLVDDYCYSP